MDYNPKAKGYSLTDYETQIIKHVSVDRRLFNDSAALRQIIKEWAESHPDYIPTEDPVPTQEQR